jgi:hypothetical protein
MSVSARSTISAGAAVSSEDMETTPSVSGPVETMNLRLSAPSDAAWMTPRKSGLVITVVASESVMMRRTSSGGRRNIAGVTAAPARQIAL